MKTFVEIHALQNFAPSNLNRDDTGAPKDAIFGGVRRARISSQCFKRAIRQHFPKCLTKEAVGDRTKLLLREIIKKIGEKGRANSDEIEEKARLALAAIEINIKEDGKSEYLLFLGKQEIESIAEIIHSKWDIVNAPVQVSTDGKKQGKAKKQAAQAADPGLKKALLSVINGGKAVDVALFGRMLADMPEKNQNAACQVAHAISTHAVEREFDYYTAVDDLKPDETPGADM
ncbi:MAG: type I-E CRISPR-associated protein Cas7/Cse4/CasC, partial [Victivallaceae bacterium]